MAIKVLMMDFYGTLVHDDEDITGRVCREICDRSPLMVQPTDIAKDWWGYMSDAYHACNGRNFMPLREIQKAVMEELTEKYRSRADATALTQSIINTWEKPMKYEDLNSFLQMLPLEVCIVANSDEQTFQRACGNIQLSFDNVVLSETCRCYKPNKGIFMGALEKMNIEPDQALFVGDSLAFDIRPAMECGMHTAWMNRTGRNAGEPQPDVVINTLTKLKLMIR